MNAGSHEGVRNYRTTGLICAYNLRHFGNVRQQAALTGGGLTGGSPSGTCAGPLGGTSSGGGDGSGSVVGGGVSGSTSGGVGACRRRFGMRGALVMFIVFSV
ncbi:protein of unknown function [Paraburkholderia dioscoreae]|uniref:Uncharacterized protein n=1 Tax=Paraburkholderia dioscoreae TaxID=2604047 RepID=A0A5Q4YXZ1_9BURK|nr:protein of unknown function [Paraburkholderia dioscoreae]